MKRCCQITSVHSVFDSRIFQKEARVLAEAGYQVTLIAQHDKNETVDGVKIIALPKPRNRFSRILFLTFKVYRIALREKATIYHFHDPELLVLMGSLKNRTKSRVIYDVHEDLSEVVLSRPWIPKIIRYPLSKALDFLERHISKKFDYVITATLDIKKRFSQHKSVDIRNYPSVTDFEGSSGEKELLS